MFYHVRVALKAKSAKASSSVAFELDLTRQKITQSIAIPFLRKKMFYCGGTVVEPGTVESINFNETSQSSTELRPFILAERAASNILTLSPPELEVTWKGKDITREILDEASSQVYNEPMERLKSQDASKTKVFLVHGHDILALDQTELLLRRWGLDPIIIRDKASRGMTVIEKIEANSDVGYALVLLTPDDVGGVKGGQELQPRARQNAIWEWGYLVAKLGRNRVACLRKDSVEVPSDLHGVVRIDVGDNIRDSSADIARELRAAGYVLRDE